MMRSLHEPEHRSLEGKKTKKTRWLFELKVEPALKSRSGFHAAKMFESLLEGSPRRRRHYSYERVLKLSLMKDGGVRWSSCIFIPRKLMGEAVILRRSTIGGQKLWIPVRPSSSGQSKWTELIVPREVDGVPIWVSAEGIVGYLRPVRILGVQVWLPTPTKKDDLDATRQTRQEKTGRSSKQDEKCSRVRRLNYSEVKLNSGSVITSKSPRLVVLDLPASKRSGTGEENRSRERIILKRAARTIARKLVEKEDSVYPQVELGESSSESEEEDEPPGRREVEEQPKPKAAPRPPRDRKGRFYGLWREEVAKKEEVLQESGEGRRVTSSFLPEQEVPIIRALGQTES